MSEPTTNTELYVSPKYEELTFIANLLRREIAVLDYVKGQSLLIEKRTTEEDVKDKLLEDRAELTTEYILATDALKLVQNLITGIVQMRI